MKALIQAGLRSVGYRLVPRDRDAYTLQERLSALPIRTVLDVGANIGRTCKEWLIEFPQAHVHGIEAEPAVFAQLKSNVAGMEDRITPWNFAASDEPGQITFFRHEDHPSSSSMLRATNFSEEALPFTKDQREVSVEARRLDDVFIDSGIKLEPDIFMKLDVQGAELRVLMGAPKLLARTRAVLCEINLAPVYESQPSFTDIAAVLERSGFVFAGFIEQFHLADGTAIYFDGLFFNAALDR